MINRLSSPLCHLPKMTLIACLCGQLIIGAVANTGELSPESTSVVDKYHVPDGKTNANPVTSDKVKQELSGIITSESYSQTTTQSRWERNKPKQSKEPSKFGEWLGKWFEKIFGDVNMTGVSQGMGVIGKGMALLFLLGLAWWLHKTRQTWLVWLQSFKRPNLSKNSPVAPAPVWRPDEMTWTDLPEGSKLVAFLKSLLSQGLWLPALSALYRGTLREMGVRHHLPIDRHQTEDECAWLLAQSEAGSHEREYFERLIKLWRASAYGQKIPQGVTKGDYGDILELIELWAKLYGQRAMA